MIKSMKMIKSAAMICGVISVASVVITRQPSKQPGPLIENFCICDFGNGPMVSFDNDKIERYLSEDKCGACGFKKWVTIRTKL